MNEEELQVRIDDLEREQNDLLYQLILLEDEREALNAEVEQLESQLSDLLSAEEE